MQPPIAVSYTAFCQLLKRERVRRRTYPTRDAARQDVFEYIELFYNPKRKHTNNGMLSPIDEANSILFGNLPNSPIFPLFGGYFALSFGICRRGGGV